MSTNDAQSGGQPHLKKQDLATLVSTEKIQMKDFLWKVWPRRHARCETFVSDFNDSVASSIVFEFQKKKIKHWLMIF